MTSMSQILTQISNMDRDNLKRIQEAIRRRWDALQREKARGFKVGDPVKFTTRDGRVIRGTVEKKNPKTIVVVSSSPYGRWRISPGLLTVAE